MALEAQGRLREAALELRRAESLARDREGRERARRLLGTLGAEASDSLRTLFAADSVALAKQRGAAPAGCCRRSARCRPGRIRSERGR